MAEVQKTNNIPNFKKNTSPAMKRSGFKMKRSPVKQGLLSDFFGNVGEQLRKGQKERGIFSEKAKAEKRERRKTGESKFQYDVRKKKEAKKTNKPYDIKSSSVFEPKKFGHEGKDYFGPTTSDLDRALIDADLKNKKLNLKSDVFDLSKKIPKVLTAQEMINKAYKGTGNDWAKASKNAMDMFGVTLTELINKRSPAKKSRGYKMKRK